MHVTGSFPRTPVERQSQKTPIETIVPSANRLFDLEELRRKLTNSFVQSITDRSWSFDKNIEHPVVQVLHTDQDAFQTYSTQFDKVKIVCLTVIDGSRNRLLARVAAHLTDTAVHLREGHVLCLNMFNDLIMKPNDQSPPTAVIVVVQMDIIGSGPILDDEVNMLTPVV
jgi:hypothetical protein